MLARRPNLTMAELAKAMVMDRTTLVRALRPLLRRGLVVAAHVEGQRDRRLQVVLTRNGLAKLDEAAAHWEAAQASFERGFGKQRATHLRNELFHMTSDVPGRTMKS
jgi:DNA-binding MarR family transcriptional regulator